MTQQQGMMRSVTATNTKSVKRVEGVVPVTTVKSGEESYRPASLDVVERAALATERGSAGLPIGVQVAAHLWREDLVLAAMSAIEHAVRAQNLPN